MKKPAIKKRSNNRRKKGLLLAKAWRREFGGKLLSMA